MTGDRTCHILRACWLPRSQALQEDIERLSDAIIFSDASISSLVPLLAAWLSERGPHGSLAAHCLTLLASAEARHAAQSVGGEAEGERSAAAGGAAVRWLLEEAGSSRHEKKAPRSHRIFALSSLRACLGASPAPPRSLLAAVAAAVERAASRAPALPAEMLASLAETAALLADVSAPHPAPPLHRATAAVLLRVASHASGGSAAALAPLGPLLRSDASPRQSAALRAAVEVMLREMSVLVAPAEEGGQERCPARCLTLGSSHFCCTADALPHALSLVAGGESPSTRSRPSTRRDDSALVACVMSVALGAPRQHGRGFAAALPGAERQARLQVLHASLAVLAEAFDCALNSQVIADTGCDDRAEEGEEDRVAWAAGVVGEARALLEAGAREFKSVLRLQTPKAAPGDRLMASLCRPVSRMAVSLWRRAATRGAGAQEVAEELFRGACHCVEVRCGFSYPQAPPSART